MATGKVIGKLLKFKGFKAVDLAFIERRRTTYSRQAVQERLSMFAVRATRQDSEGSTGGALVEGYSRRWLDRVVHVRSSRDPLSNPRTC